jgi:signal transduction histidine kinase/DNA-binding response OmpR family regulator
MNESDRPGDALSGTRGHEVEQPDSAVHRPSRPPRTDDRPNVLLVDDQPARLLTYEAILDGVGVNCVRALSGREALHQLLTHTFAVILLDVSMPEMDGFETARFIREHPKFERTPIIFVTGVHVTELDTLRGYAAGAIDYIAVPVVPEILRSKVALLVELHRRRAELEALNHELEVTRARLEIEHSRALATRSEQQLLAEKTLQERELRTTALLKLSDEFRSLTVPADLAFAAARILAETLGVSRCGYGTIDLQAETISIERDWHADGIKSLAGVLHFREHGSYIDDLKRGETVICPDVREDPRTAATASVLESISVRSFVNMPVTEQGGFVALLYLTDVAVRHWTPQEIEFIREVADRTRVAVERRRNEQARLLREQQLRDAARRKDEFIALLAHELRNPLVPIRTGVELLKNARRQPELIDSIRPMMERQIGHVVRMIDDLLDVSRITSGKLELQRQRVTLAAVIDAAIESTRAAIQAGGLELMVSLSDPEWVLEVDPTRLSQVIANLLQNALQFTPGGGRIQLTALIDATTQAAAPELQVTICDSGIGMDEQMLSKIFDVFAQASPPGRGSHSGLGLGLALSQRLVAMHGGTLSGHSDGSGRGSEFRIRIPAPRIVPGVESGFSSESTQLTGIRVMVVDDNHDVAIATRMLIENWGGVVDVAYDGTAALAALVGFQPDVLLIDIGMPGMDGYETCKRVRALLGNRVAVVAVSGWGQQQDRQLAEQAGFDAHLTKPPRPGQLAELIRELARRRACG